MSLIDDELNFIYTIDAMKGIERRTGIVGDTRRENDAEHSWHIGVMAMLLSKYADKKIDSDRVIRMLLVHDLIEIYAGDTFAYDTAGYEDKAEREMNAAHKLYDSLGIASDEFFALWQEFEACESDESVFANGIDRLQPMMLNLANNGGTWVEHGVPIDKVLLRLEPLKRSSTVLYEWAHDKIVTYFDENKKSTEN